MQVQKLTEKTLRQAQGPGGGALTPRVPARRPPSRRRRQEHARNLLSPSTPYFFNTVYDPYRDGSDFVRGFPYSLRSGVATAVN